MTYAVFLDTNLIFRDFFFKSSDMKMLLKLSKNDPFELCITEFTFNEIVKKYRDELRPSIKAIRSQKSKLAMLKADEVINFENINANKLTEIYREELYKIVDEYSIKIIEYPSGDQVVKKISEKYFKRKKPFDENKNSFQDAIMWESIVEYCSREDFDTVVFISNNHKDFANNDKADIHEDIENDIYDLLYYHSIPEFLENEIDNLTDYFTDYYAFEEKELIEKMEFHFDFKDDLRDTVDYMLMNNNFVGEYFEGWGTEGQIEKMDFTIVEKTLDIEEKSLLISCYAHLSVDFSIEIVNSSYEKGDPGDGMLSESSDTEIYIQYNITYLIDEEEFIDYVQIDSGFA